jgi:NAD(P)-dependent dehydrogenase (short-subunit alcohol dehydrogenase family)
VNEPRVAVVTGAGTGLGRATAEVLGESGMAVVLVGRRQNAIAGVAAGSSFPAGALTVSADVASAEGRALVVEATLERFGRIDALVNNAGISHREPLLSHSEEGWRQVMATNLDACFFLAQAVLPTMRAQQYGRIVNVGSVYGSLALNAALYPGMFGESEDGPLRQPAYHTSKGGVLNLTRDLAAAVGRWGVTVNTLSPGMFMTEQSRGIVSDEVVESLSAMTPVGRFGEPREIGYAVRYLVSEEAAFVTGAELRVDGGWSSW